MTVKVIHEEQRKNFIINYDNYVKLNLWGQSLLRWTKDWDTISEHDFGNMLIIFTYSLHMKKCLATEGIWFKHKKLKNLYVAQPDILTLTSKPTSCMHNKSSLVPIANIVTLYIYA